MNTSALHVPAALAARVRALRFALETDLVVSFAHPKGEPVTVLVTPWGRDSHFDLGTLESFVAGCEAGSRLENNNDEKHNDL